MFLGDDHKAHKEEHHFQHNFKEKWGGVWNLGLQDKCRVHKMKQSIWSQQQWTKILQQSLDQVNPRVQVGKKQNSHESRDFVSPNIRNFYLLLRASRMMHKSLTENGQYIKDQQLRADAVREGNKRKNWSQSRP